MAKRWSGQPFSSAEFQLRSVHPAAQRSGKPFPLRSEPLRLGPPCNCVYSLFQLCLLRRLFFSFQLCLLCLLRKQPTFPGDVLQSMANRAMRGWLPHRTSEEVLDTQKIGLYFGRKIGVRPQISYVAPVGNKGLNHVLQVLVKRSIRRIEEKPHRVSF